MVEFYSHVRSDIEKVRFSSQRLRLPTTVAYNLASSCALLIISETDETYKQKSLAFVFDLG